MLAAMPHKPSNLSDLAHWKFTSNSHKLSMDIHVRASLSLQSTDSGTGTFHALILPSLYLGLQCTNVSSQRVGEMAWSNGHRKKYTISILTSCELTM